MAPGSFFHLTECFGPVLGLMRAETLTEAIELQNATEFGLTAGLHSLEPREVRSWLDLVQAGNVYVNRGITGAIVRRQPFGGWKRSSVGLGSKAGGPNYLMQFGRWNDLTRSGGSVLAPTPAPTTPGLAAFAEAVENIVGAEGAGWLRRALADDDRAWNAEYGVVRDETGLASEANIFRYRPADVAIRVTAEASPTHVARLLAAAHRAGSRAEVVPEPGIPAESAAVLDAARG